MQEATRYRTMISWDLLYANDLVMFAETEYRSIENSNTWNRSLRKRGLKVEV